MHAIKFYLYYHPLFLFLFIIILFLFYKKILYNLCDNVLFLYYNLLDVHDKLDINSLIETETMNEWMNEWINILLYIEKKQKNIIIIY